MRRLRLLLDTNVLVDAQVRDLLLRIAEADLIDVRWSREILGELRGALVAKVGRDPARVDRLIATLDRAFPEACVAVRDELVDRLDLPDPDDRHVLAAAIAGECDWLVTDNVRDFPDDALRRWDLDTIPTDNAIDRLAQVFGERIGPIVLRQVGALRRPTTSPEEFVERLARRHPLAAMAVGQAIGLERSDLARLGIDVALGDTGSHHAVIRLLDAIEHRDHDVIAGLMAPDLAARLTGPEMTSASELCGVLDSMLSGVWTTPDWGYLMPPRRFSDDVEIVLVVRSGEAFTVAEPMSVMAHAFELTWRGGAWIVTEIDRSDLGLLPQASP